MKSFQSKQRWILYAILLTLLLRVGLLIIALFNPDRVLVADSGSYIQPALSLLKDGYYSYPSGFRMPLYPAFIASIMEVFGNNLLPIVMIQVLLGLGTVYLTYRIGLLLEFSPASSALGAVILSFSLETLVLPYFIHNETFFTFLLIFSTFALVKFVKGGRLTWLVSTSLLTGLVSLCRPVVAFGLISLVILLVFNHHARILQRIGHAVIYTFLLIAIFIAPWTYRNAQVSGVSTITTELDLYWLWGAATINADQQGISVDAAKQDLDEEINHALEEHGMEATEKNLYHIRTEVGQEIIFDHPFRFVYLTLRYDLRGLLPGMGYALRYLGLANDNIGGIELLQSQGLSGLIQHYFSGKLLAGIVLLPFILLLGITYIAAVMGAIALFKKRDWLSLAILLLPTAYLLLVTGYSANARYRVPAMPFITLLAGIGLLTGWEAFKTRYRKPGKRKR